MVAQVKAEKQRVNYTPEEYLELEEKSEFRNEYIQGEIKPVTGGTPNHNEIAGNFYTFLKLALRGKSYKVFMSDLRLWIPQYNVYTYPDIMVIKGQPVLQNNRNDTVINPLLIIEVLSKSTKNYDQGDKFDYYRSIPEFTEYILVDQYRYYVKQFAKADDGRWWLSEYQDEDDSLSFASLDDEIKLSDIYREIEFS
ncbi:MAG: Uma2 family endonuclease [Xenococcaceae cyanobacterium MO_188.B32]|nr:Uma2 family endonuclease [Xenococcaceae cyanobacterium MO_188.B32]